MSRILYIQTFFFFDFVTVGLSNQHHNLVGLLIYLKLLCDRGKRKSNRNFITAILESIIINLNIQIFQRLSKFLSCTKDLYHVYDIPLLLPVERLISVCVQVSQGVIKFFISYIVFIFSFKRHTR